MGNDFGSDFQAGGVLHDRYGRKQYIFKTPEQSLDPTDIQGSGTILDSQGREHLVVNGLPATAIYYPDGSVASVVQRPNVIDVRDHGAKFDNSTDDTAAIQAALDEAQLTYIGLSGANAMPPIVVMPRGRAVISAPLKLGWNQVLQGQGQAATYLTANLPLNAVDGKTDPVLTLKTGQEVQCELRSFGMILGANTDGIHLIQTGGASILGDTRHVIDDVVVVQGSTALVLDASTECRVNNFTGQRQTLVSNARYSRIVWIGGTDHMLSEITLGQPNSGVLGYALALQTANTRCVNAKVYGGGGSGAIVGGAGQRNQLVACEVQDYNGPGIGCADVTVDCVVDSCLGPSYFFGSGYDGVARNCLSVNRGGAYTPQWAIQMEDDNGFDAEIIVRGAHGVLFSNTNPQTGAGNRLKVNRQGGGVKKQAAYAATYTPNPFDGSEHFLAALTGAVTIADPTCAPFTGTPPTKIFYIGMTMRFVIPQDATGGRTVTFGASYKTSAAIPTTANSVTAVNFAWDGSFWREIGRVTT